MTVSKLFIDEDSDNHILIIDGHNLIFRTIIVAQEENDKNHNDDPNYSYWKHLFLYHLKALIEKFDPTRVILTIDSEKSSWRKNIYPEYKENRKLARAKSKVDFKAFFKVLNPFIEEIQDLFGNMEILKFDEVEGDDVIAVVCQNFTDKITIISTDKDFHQLQVYKNVNQYDPVKKSKVNVLNPKSSLELKIIGGDKNDNIPAIFPRCGKATSVKVLNSDLITKIYDDEYIKEEENLKSLIKECKIPPLEVRKNIERNKQLIDLKMIPTGIKKMILDNLQNEPLRKFNGRGFTNFLVRHELPNIAKNIGDYTKWLGKDFRK